MHTSPCPQSFSNQSIVGEDFVLWKSSHATIFVRNRSWTKYLRFLTGQRHIANSDRLRALLLSSPFLAEEWERRW